MAKTFTVWTKTDDGKREFIVASGLHRRFVAESIVQNLSDIYHDGNAWVEED